MSIKLSKSLKFLVFAAALFSAFFVFFSCSNLFDDIKAPLTDGKTVTITGAVSNSQGEAGSKRAGRMALPSGAFAATEYTVTATAPGADSISGSVNNDNNTFTIALKLDKQWTITISMEAKETESDTEFKQVFQGSYAYDHALTVADVTVPISIVLAPISGGNGTIKLPMSVASGVSVATVVISGLSDSPETYTLSNGAYTINKLGVPSGAYNVTIDFKDSTGLIIYSTTQTINVLSNMTTTRWVSDGSSSPINGDGTFVVTAALVQAFARSQIYVGANPYQMHEPSDTNLGTPYAPLEHLSAALEYIQSFGDSTKDYTIHISGTQYGNFEIDSNFNNKMKSLTFCGMKDSDPDPTLNGDSDEDGTGDGSVLIISTTKPITIKDLKITGGNATNGGGIYIDSGANVTLANGAVVAGNKATYSGSNGGGGGGGVYNAGTLFMYGSAVIGDSSVSQWATSTSGCSNYSSYGGGLYNAVGATAYLGYSATNTPLELTGGICFNYSQDGEAGAVYNKGVLKMNSGRISYNGSAGYTGGVTSDGNSSNFELSGGAISYNRTYDPNNSSLYAGGVRISSTGSQFTMTGGEISYNEANIGGGISLLGCTATFTGGIIKNNTAQKGSGIVFETGTLYMGDSAVVAAGNDIWLNSSNDVATITVASSLTGTAPVATLTPDDYDREDALVVAGSGVTLANETGKFAVTPNDSDLYILGSDGKLKRGTFVTSVTVENMTLATGTSYNLVASSDFTNDNLETLLTSIKNSSISGASLDLSNTAITQLSSSTNWIPAKITSITLPPGLQTIAPQEFQNAVDLAEIRMPNDGNSYYSVEDGILYNSTKTALLRYPPAKAGEEFTLPDTVTMLGYQAFYQNKNLVRINGLNRITSFASSQSDYFLANCQKLEEIDLSGLTCDYLPYCAFQGSKVKRVILSGSVTRFLPFSFSSCPNLTEIHFGAVSPPLVSQYDNGDAGAKNFSSCNSNLKFYVPKGSKSAYLADSSRDAGFANSSYNAYATSPEALASIVFEEDPDVPNMLYVQGAYFDGSSAVADSEVFIADRELIIPDLYVSDHEVTQAEYQAVMGTNPSNFSSNPADGEVQGNRPVENMTWYDAVNYCNALSEAKNLTSCYTINGTNVTCDFSADGYRLPTEAEWEYIARGGNLTNSGQTTYSGSNSADTVAWHTGNSGSKTHEVKKKAANTLGIYDMSGNVYELCWDWYDVVIPADSPATGVTSGTDRLNRGGCWADNTNSGSSCSVLHRGSSTPSGGNLYLGFRVVRTAQ